MTPQVDRRINPRLKLSYPIRILREEGPGRPIGHTVTQNLSARGAYFSTFHGEPYQEGLTVTVVVSVPHRLATGTKEVTLDLRGEGRVVRVESPANRIFGEDGVSMTGVAIEFVEPLSFHYCWV